MTAVQNYLPYLLSIITFTTMWMAGSNKQYTWLIGLIGQGLWAMWIVSMQAWGLLPTTFGLTLIYAYNNSKWNEQARARQGLREAFDKTADGVVMKWLAERIRNRQTAGNDPRTQVADVIERVMGTEKPDVYTKPSSLGRSSTYEASPLRNRTRSG